MFFTKLLQNLFILLLSLSLISSAYPQNHDITTAPDKILAKALYELENHNISQTIELLQKLPKNSLNYNILAWAIAITGQKDTPSQQMTYVIEKLRNWPNQDIIKNNYEKIAYDELTKNANSSDKQKIELRQIISKSQAKQFLAYFNKFPPKSAEAIAIYTTCALIQQDTLKAKKYLQNIWHNKVFNTNQQTIILSNAQNLLKEPDHIKRLNMLLLHKKFEAAEQIAPLAKLEDFCQNYINILNHKANSNLSLQKILKYNNLLSNFAEINYLINQQNYIKAATKILQSQNASKNLLCPDIWAKLRLSLARDLIFIQQPALAASLLTQHNNENIENRTNQDFYHGWIKLRKLNKAQQAIEIFKQILKYNKQAPIIAKTNYWIARSYEAIGQKAKSHYYYSKSAHFSADFYGQLSNAKLQNKTLTLDSPAPSQQDQQNFLALTPVKAIQKLQQLNDKKYSRLLNFALAQTLPNAKYLAILAALAIANNDYFSALKIAKIGSLRGFDMGALTHPLGAIKDEAKISPQDKALVYAIARQESEFKTEAISRVGARGLMQLMPQTAKEIAKQLFHKFSLANLTNNSAYNAKIGSVFLKKQLKRFNGSYILTFISYNAGPKRAQNWVEKYGDPRKLNLESAIDWIENIPYSETRNYVLRVLENLEFYKYILTGKYQITTDLTAGKA